VIEYVTDNPPPGNAETMTITSDAETPFPAALAICIAIVFSNAVVAAELPRIADALLAATVRLPTVLP
jgi:hypothetical protein